MCVGSARTGVAGAVLILALLGQGSAAEPPKAPTDDRGPDLAPFIDLGKHYVKPAALKKDEKSGFVVGGKNDTVLIRRLKEINGRTIADLEKDMRPGAKSEVGSESGFLGADEKLLDVLAADNKFVVDDLGLIHQELARHLHALASIGFWQLEQNKDGAEFLYHGRRFRVKLLLSAGAQPSPFKDGTESGSNATVENLDTGKKLEYALLVPYMIERYGFYEGTGTPYRVDPRKVIEVLDFLKKPAKKP
jgi:hypothetical protein